MFYLVEINTLSSVFFYYYYINKIIRKILKR